MEDSCTDRLIRIYFTQKSCRPEQKEKFLIPKGFLPNGVQPFIQGPVVGEPHAFHSAGDKQTSEYTPAHSVRLASKIDAL
jgi:hypothetical protein